LGTRRLVSSLAIAAAVAVPVADAHPLSKATAKRGATKAGSALARAVGGSAVYDCNRRSIHAFTCRISAVSREGDVCVTVVRVAYRDHSSRTLSRRVVSGPDCQPPELPGL
jgi:hypothetical protein